MDAPHVYVRAWALDFFQSYQYPNLSEVADRVSGQLRGDKECPFSGVTKSGRVWRKVPESGARSVALAMSAQRRRMSAVVHAFPCSGHVCTAQKDVCSCTRIPLLWPCLHSTEGCLQLYTHSLALAMSAQRRCDVSRRVSPLIVCAAFLLITP